MSRLTKEQAMNLYGRNLPTPTIEKMTLLDVKNDDEYLLSLRDLQAIDFPEDAIDSMVDIMSAEKERTISTTTRVDLDIAFYLQTWEGFDVNELTRELFEKITTTPGETGTTDTSNSLFINAAFVLPSSPDAGDSVSVLRRKNKLNLLSMFYDDADALKTDQFAKLDLQTSYGTQNMLNAHIANLPGLYGGVSREYEISLPLSEFFEVAQLTAEYDADDNPIIKVSNIKLTFYITNFAIHPNITFYAAVSTESPPVLASRSPLDPISYSMNFSDLTYEDLVKNGSISSISEPVFVDSGGVYYPNMPLRALNKKYYKIDDYGPKQIIDQTNALLAEYRKYLATDSQLLDAINEIKIIIQTEQNAINFLQLMNQVGQVYSETNEVTRYSRFYERFRILVKNADAALRNQQEVVKRVYRNYKVNDLRAYVPPPMDAFSYVHQLSQDRDYLYEEIFHSNVANFVPIDSAGAAFPGKAELPTTPSERFENWSTESEAIRNEAIRLMLPSDSGGFDYGHGAGASTADNARERAMESKLPWDARSGMGNYNNLLTPEYNIAGLATGTGGSTAAYSIGDVDFSATEISDMLGSSYQQDHPLDRAALKIAWWIYHVWAGRFVQGSEHKIYRANDDFDGVHWYVGFSDNDSLDKVNSQVRHKPSQWLGRYGAKSGGKDALPPDRFRLLVQSLSNGESYAPPDRDMDDVVDIIVGYDAIGVEKSLEDLNYYGVPAAAPNHDVELTIEKFGYDPNGALAPHVAHNSLQYGVTDRIPQNALPAFWYLKDTRAYDRTGYYEYYLNDFFWSSCASADVWSIYQLGSLDEQLTFWVPKSKIIGTTGRGIDTDDIEDQDGYSYSNPDADNDLETYAEDAADFWDGTAMIHYGDGTELRNVAFASIAERYERVGGVRAISTRRPMKDGGLSPWTDGGQHGNQGIPTGDSNVPYVRVKRRKIKRIYRDVRALVRNIFGMDESGDGVAGGPEEEDASSTNSLTTLDTYIQEVPGLVADEVSRKMFDRLDDLPYRDFDTIYDISQQAQTIVDRAHVEYLEAIEKYFSKDLCHIYISTASAEYLDWMDAPTGDNRRRLTGGNIEYASYIILGKFEGSYLGAQLAYETLLPYGNWRLGPAAVKGGRRGGTGTVSVTPEGANLAGIANRESYEMFKMDFGEAIKAIMISHFVSMKPSLREKARVYLQSRQNLDAFQSNIGIHSTLAEVDIVLNKYGYFFFDMEKYIRKRSLMSRVINVDRLLGYMESGQEMTNSAVRLEEVQMHLANFGERALDAPYSPRDAAWGRDPPMPTEVMLTLSNRLDTPPYSPINFQSMRFYGERNGDGLPVVYNRIKRLNEIRFDQISEYTKNPLYSGTNDSMPGQKFDDDASSGNSGIPLMGDVQAIEDNPGDGDYSAYRGTQAAAAENDFRQGVLEGQEVDIAAVMDAVGTSNVYTKLALRNYSFTDFNSSALNGGLTWVDNYRLLCFKYQFFMDDDLAYNNDAHEEYADTLKSVDDVKITVSIRDNSRELVKALCDKYEEEYLEFLPYFEEAQEACAFGAFDQRFNKFFVDAMLEKYPTTFQAPWFRMVATYVTVYNLFSDKYAGNRARMEEHANNTLDTIRPETGTLSSLMNFKDACDVLKETLEEIKSELADIENGFAVGGDGEHAGTIDGHGARASFTVYRTLASEVIDHIGDYTKREEFE